MLDFEHFENLVQSIGKYSFAEELVDIVNADLTFTLFFFLGVMTGYKQIFGDPIHCMPPAAYTKWEDYYNSYCYIQSKIIIQSMHPHSFNRNIKTDPDLEQLVYYQWVPYVFMLMAILFRVPRMFWTTFARFFCYGEDIGSFIEDCNTIKEKTKPKERAKAISKLAEFICRTMNMRSRRSLFGQSMAVFCVLRKLLAVIIVLSQFLLLCYLIPSRFNLLWGFELLTYKWTTMEHSLEGIEGVFPTLVRCDVSQMVSSNFTGKEVVQDANYVMFKLKMPCVLMQNFIIEKMFAFVYFWLLVILVVNVGSLLKKMMILVWPQHRYRMANQHLSNRERLSDAYKEATGVGANSTQLEWQRRQFIDKALSADGILMFNFLRARVGSFLAQDLIVELWKAYAKPAFQTADCVSEQSIVSVRITDKRNSDADASTEEETTRLVAYTLNDRITLFDVAPSAPPTEE